MYIDKIIYIATNQTAITDDIFTLDITGLKSSVPVQNIMISGHSILLTGGGYVFNADVDTLVVRATDLDFDGHVIDVGGLQHRIPRTGNVTKTYRFDVSAIGAVEITKPLIDPATGLVIAALEPTQPAPLAAQIGAVAGMPAAQGAGIGLGVLVLGGIILFALSRRKKR